MINDFILFKHNMCFAFIFPTNLINNYYFSIWAEQKTTEKYCLNTVVKSRTQRAECMPWPNIANVFTLIACVRFWHTVYGSSTTAKSIDWHLITKKTDHSFSFSNIIIPSLIYPKNHLLRVINEKMYRHTRDSIDSV